MRFLLIVFLPFILFAESYLISSIPLPKTYVQNIDGYDCDETCLKELMEREQVFTFLAHAQERLETAELNEYRLIHVALFNLGAIRQDNRLRIALLLPYRVIGRYANSTTNAVFAYMLTKNRDYVLKSYQIEDEDPETVKTALDAIAEDGFYYVIAPVTKSGATAIADINPDLTVYFPTINKNDLNSSSPSLLFGGIDYRAQIDALLNESVTPLAIFYDNSRLGKELHDYTKQRYLEPGELNDTRPPVHTLFNVSQPQEATLEEAVPKVAYSFAVDKHTSNLETELKENGNIQNASIFLNTPIVKSGMIMSQLTLYDTNATNVLSTQINYDPLLFSITQYQDRKEMIIANAIGQSNNVLVEANLLLGNDIVYDWINYAATVGADLLFHMITRSEREYKLPLVENQITYPLMLVTPSHYRFIEYHSPEPDEPEKTETSLLTDK